LRLPVVPRAARKRPRLVDNRKAPGVEGLVGSVTPPPDNAGPLACLSLDRTFPALAPMRATA
jgi:hypothetical protein